jgi:acylphosphatase
MTDSLRIGSAPAPAQRIVRAIIGGRVQGVCYRAWTQEEAEALGVRGWVRNRTDGDVEAVLAGAPAAVESLCRRLWRGPPAARVDRVEVTEAGERDLAVIAGDAGFRQIATI